MSLLPLNSLVNHVSQVQLIASDVDGTLTCADRFTPQLLTAIAQLAQAKLPLLLVTGRSAGWVDALRNYLPVVGAIALLKKGRSCHYRELDKLYPAGYSRVMLEIRKTEIFVNWLDSLRDGQSRARVLVRIERLIAGNPGDVKPVGEGVSELRINYGPGYRVYYKQQGQTVVILLAGGDKRTQSQDIQIALQLARTL
jgi:putative addiction module killer protein